MLVLSEVNCESRGNFFEEIEDEKKFPQILDQVEKIFFDTQKKSSWEDADSLHRARSRTQLSDKFSDSIQELFLSSYILSNKHLRVKFDGYPSALLAEVENIISQTTEETEEKAKTMILDALDNLKILDPACGSGAFPMGILQKVVQILSKIDPENTIWLEKIVSQNPPEVQKTIREHLLKKDLNYVRKLGIIQKSIFGVDIQEIAVEISRLRFFLSLVVDEKAEEIEPLPNLDFKFVCANSLLSLPDISTGQNDLFADQEREKIFAEMKKIREEYFLAHAGKKDGLKYKFSQF